MKLKSFFISLILTLCALGAVAQTTYTEALDRYFTVNGGLEANATQMRTSFTTITNMFVAGGEVTLPAGYTVESIVNEYISKRLKDDFVAVFVPYFAESTTIAEINKLSELYATPAGQLANKHIIQLNSDPTIMSDIENLCYQAGIDIGTGKTPRKVQVNATPQRQKLFHQYYESAGLKKMLNDLISAQLSADNDLSADQKAAARAFFNENFEIIYLNASEKYTTDADLECYIKLTSTPEYKKVSKIVSDVLQDAQGFGMSIVMKYSEWLQNHK